jgi:hypothetical protein
MIGGAEIAGAGGELITNNRSPIKAMVRRHSFIINGKRL